MKQPMIVKVLLVIVVVSTSVIAGMATAFAAWWWGGVNAAIAIINGMSVCVAFTGAVIGLIAYLRTN